MVGVEGRVQPHQQPQPPVHVLPAHGQGEGPLPPDQLHEGGGAEGAEQSRAGGEEEAGERWRQGHGDWRVESGTGRWRKIGSEGEGGEGRR